MKTNGATWKSYLDSWPKGQWMDDCNERINGICGNDFSYDDGIPDDAVVEFSEGVVYDNEKDQHPTSLTTHFKRWLKNQTHTTLLVVVPKEKQDELQVFLQSIKGSILKT